MTAEVAVLNQTAVALAADSLATVEPGGAGLRKTYQVNKLFTLSKHHPVGVMVFDSAEIMEVPLETVIKVYRKELGKKSFPTIQEYAEHFLDYLSSAHSLFPPESQEQWYGFIIKTMFSRLDEGIDEAVKREIGTQGILDPPPTVSDSTVKRIIGETIRKLRAAIESVPRRTYLPNSFPETLENSHHSLIEEAIEKNLKNKPLSITDLRNLRWIASNVVAVQWSLPVPETGVVIAGFGE